MRKLDTSAITNTIGMPIKSGTLIHLQDAYTEAMAAIMQAQIPNYSATTVYVLYGCVQGTTTTSGGGGLLITVGNMSAGAVFYNGEIFMSPYQTFSNIGTMGEVLVANINTTTFFTDPTADPVIFTDSIARNIHQLRTISYGIAAPGSGTADYPNFVRIFPAPSFSSVVLSTTPVTWTNVGGSYNNAAYKVMANEVALCGVINGTIPGPGTFTLFTLPVGARPAAIIGFYLDVLIGSSITPLLMQVETNGQVVLNTPDTGTFTIYLDNIRFRLV